MDNIAEFVYGKENILSREQYMANEIYLEDALRDGLVVAPKNYDWDIALMGKTEFTNYLNQLTTSFKNIDDKEELTEEEKEIQKSEIIEPIMDSFEINNEYGKNASIKLICLSWLDFSLHNITNIVNFRHLQTFCGLVVRQK